ncbi:MAG: DNA-binding response regulator [Actinomycetaceae bacterium]|nr:DNA-binding response regulator [Actinomycetaceae bacterium]
MSTAAVSPESKVEILLYSDDVTTRQAIIEAIGDTVPGGSVPLAWQEVATPDGFRKEFKEDRFAALILDGEAGKEGGMSLAKELATLTDKIPPIVMLTVRQQDSWLARWSGAQEILEAPFEARAVEAALARVLKAS